MDLKLLDAEPTALERTAIDHLLGPAPTRWEGGERSPGEEGHTARTGHDARSSGTSSCRRCTRCRSTPAGSARAA